MRGQGVERQNVEGQCRMDKVSNGQRVELTKCQIDKVSNRQSVEQTKCQFEERENNVSNCLMTEISSYQINLLLHNILYIFILRRERIKGIIAL